LGHRLEEDFFWCDGKALQSSKEMTQSIFQKIILALLGNNFRGRWAVSGGEGETEVGVLNEAVKFFCQPYQSYAIPPFLAFPTPERILVQSLTRFPHHSLSLAI
jgi:hypothetical protein